MSNPMSFAPISQGELIARLAVSLIVGAVIGLERETQDKPAGLRTNTLVSFGAAMFVLIPIQIGAAQQNLDTLGRAISGVISGVGFIGAGTILHSSRVKGLTSAAAIWLSAALGVAVACGLWMMSIVGAIAGWFVLSFLKKFEAYL